MSGNLGHSSVEIQRVGRVVGRVTGRVLGRVVERRESYGRWAVAVTVLRGHAACVNSAALNSVTLLSRYRPAQCISAEPSSASLHVVSIGFSFFD